MTILLIASLIPIFVFADGWDATKPSHATLYADTITSKTDGSSVNIADSQGLFVTGDITTLGKVGIGITSNLRGKIDIHENSASNPTMVISQGSSTGNALEINAGIADASGDLMVVTGLGNVGIGTTNPVNKLSVISGVATITKSTSDDDKYRPIITGGSKASVSDNVQVSLFQSGYDAVFTLHLVAFIDENNQMSKVYNVHVLFGSPSIAEVSSHSWGAGVSSINIAYVNADRTIRATVDTSAGQSTTVYWSIYGLGYRSGDGTFDIQ